MSLLAAIRSLVRRIEAVESALNQHDRRLNNIFREGKVTEVDYEKGLAKVKAQDLDTTWVPWTQRAGDVRDWTPPKVGERVVIASPTGEPGRGMIMDGGYSDAFPQNHNKGAEAMRTLGATSIHQTADKIVLTVGGSSITITSGEITVLTPKYTVTP